MKHFFTYLVLLLITLCTSCRKEVKETRQEAIVNITTSLANTMSSVTTKAVRTGAVFLNYDSYGICVFKNGTLDTPHKSNSSNIRAYNYDMWRYYPSGSSSYTSDLTISSREDAATADLYAYVPWIDRFSVNIERIPYSVRSQIDIMYAEENLATYENSIGGNQNLSPTSPDPLNAHFSFKHLYALLVFNFKLLNAGTTYTVNSITVSLNDEEGDGTIAKLYSEGYFNAITGSFLPGATEENSITFNDGQLSFNNEPINNTTTGGNRGIMLVPTEVADNELVFTFTINGQTLLPFVLQKEQVRHYVNDTPTDTYGFKSGYKYTFYFTLDNYIYFNGITISDQWNEMELNHQAI